MSLSRGGGMPPAIDPLLLRRFGLVRAVGGLAYTAAVVVLLFLLGWEAWRLAIGVPVLAVVTWWYVPASRRRPRAAVRISLVADALVIGGAVAVLGGTSAGVVGLYAIVVVSAGILLGLRDAVAATVLAVALSLLQLLLEQLGVTPPLLWRPDLSDRATALGVGLAGLASVAFLTASYAGRLRELIEEAIDRTHRARERRARRRVFLRHAAQVSSGPAQRITDIADALREHPGSAVELAGPLASASSDLERALRHLAGVGALDPSAAARPQALQLRRTVADARRTAHRALEDRLVTVDVGEHRALGDAQAAVWIVATYLEHVHEAARRGVPIQVVTRTSGSGRVLLAVQVEDADLGGEGDERLPPGTDLFDPERSPHPLGLPLAAELGRQMGAQARAERPRAGGLRLLLDMRWAPSAAPPVVEVETSTASEGDDARSARPRGRPIGPPMPTQEAVDGR